MKNKTPIKKTHHNFFEFLKAVKFDRKVRQHTIISLQQKGWLNVAIFECIRSHKHKPHDLAIAIDCLTQSTENFSSELGQASVLAVLHQKKHHFIDAALSIIALKRAGLMDIPNEAEDWLELIQNHHAIRKLYALYEVYEDQASFEDAALSSLDNILNHTEIMQRLVRNDPLLKKIAPQKYREQDQKELYFAIKFDSVLNSEQISAIQKISGQLQNNQIVEKLNLSRHRLTHDDLQCIANMLAVNTTLQELTLSSCSIDDMGAEILAKGLSHNRTLSKLKLSHNLIGDKGVHALAQALPSTQITELYLDKNKLGSDGLYTLTTPELCMNLEFIDLGCMTCTEEQEKKLIKILNKNIQAYASYTGIHINKKILKPNDISKTLVCPFTQKIPTLNMQFRLFGQTYHIGALSKKLCNPEQEHKLEHIIEYWLENQDEGYCWIQKHARDPLTQEPLTDADKKIIKTVFKRLYQNPNDNFCYTPAPESFQYWDKERQWKWVLTFINKVSTAEAPDELMQVMLYSWRILAKQLAQVPNHISSIPMNIENKCYSTPKQGWSCVWRITTYVLSHCFNKDHMLIETQNGHGPIALIMKILSALPREQRLSFIALTQKIQKAQTKNIAQNYELLNERLEAYIRSHFSENEISGSYGEYTHSGFQHQLSIRTPSWARIFNSSDSNDSEKPPSPYERTRVHL